MIRRGYLDEENEKKAEKVRALVALYRISLSFDEMVERKDKADNLSMELSVYLRRRYPDLFNFHNLTYRTAEKFDISSVFDKTQQGKPVSMNEMPLAIQRVWKELQSQYNIKVHDYVRLKIAFIPQLFIFVDEDQVYVNTNLRIPAFFVLMERLALTQRPRQYLYRTESLFDVGGYWPIN